MKTAIALLSWAALGVTALAQVAPPLQDPAALALIDKADQVVYAPKQAGLKDLRYVQTIQAYPNVRIEVSWMAPDRSKIQILPAAGAPEHVAKLIEVMRPSLQSQAEVALDMMVGKDSRQAYAGDEITLAGERRVKVVAKSERSRKLFIESLISFDDRGLPFRMATQTKDARFEMEATFVAKAGKYLLGEASTMTPDGPVTMTIATTEQDGFTFTSSITTKRPQRVEIQEFSGFRVNTGLTEADFR